MFHDLDVWLLDRVFEKFAHWFQRLTGKTNFWLAKWFAILGYLFTFPWWMFLGAYLGRFFVSVMILLGILSCTGFVFLARQFEDRHSLADPGALNQARNIRRNPRVAMIVSILATAPILSVLILIFGLVGFLLALGGVLLFSGEYFLACTPLPPGTSKFRQWLNKMLWKVHDALAPNPKPEPGS